MLPTEAPKLEAKKPVVALCMPVARAPHMNTVRSLMNLKIPRPYRLLDAVNQQVDNARNMLTDSALSFPDVTHLFWVDDDMTFEPDALTRLLAHDLPIVGGLCFGRRHPYPPILVHMTQRGHSYQYDYPEGLVKVDATGGAFLLVKREVFEAIHAKYGKAEPPWKLDHGGEDISFCRRVRTCGFDVMVDTTVKIGHMGECCIEADYAKRNRTVEVNPYWAPRPPAEGAPVASIIVPTFNQDPNLLRAAVESAAEQTVPVEIIVIDNGSEFCIWCSDEETRAATTESGAAVRHGACSPACPGAPAHPNLRLLRIEKNAGSPWAALNLGIREMRTEWFAWLSSDDLLYPMKIERQLRAMHEVVGDGPVYVLKDVRPRALASFHAYDVLAEPAVMSSQVIVPIDWKTMLEQQKWLAYGCAVNGLTALIHRTVFEKVGGFSESKDFQIVADWELWNRIGREFFWLPIRETLATRREYGGDSQRFAKDPVKAAQWQEEDARVRALYAPLVVADMQAAEKSA
jgi:GT2 family glycosyltransferase